MSEINPADLQKLLQEATKGPWEEDRCETEDGYGKFWSRNVFDMNGKTICDMTNSDAGEVHTEYDEDGAYRFDPIAAANARLIALAPTIAAAYVALTAENASVVRERDDAESERAATAKELGDMISRANADQSTLESENSSLTAALRTARRDALEEAAKVVDHNGLHALADYIRALATRDTPEN